VISDGLTPHIYLQRVSSSSICSDLIKPGQPQCCAEDLPPRHFGYNSDDDLCIEHVYNYQEPSKEEWTRYDKLMSKLQSLSNGGEKERAEAIEYVNTALLPKKKTGARSGDEQEGSIFKKAKIFSGCSSLQGGTR